MTDDNVINEIVYAISPYVKREDVSDLRMRIAIALSKYDIKKAVTDIVPYEGDVNEQIIMRFIVAKTAAGLSQRTLEEYKRSLTNILQRIGKPYTQVAANDVRLYLAYRISRDGISKVAADNERRNLSSFFTWLRREEILLKSPMDKVEAIKITKKKKKAFQDMEIEKLRFACRDEMEKALVEVLVSTWARVSEVAEMKIEDLEDGKITVHGKGDKYREVYLSPKAQIAIQEYLTKRNDDSPYLFPKCARPGAAVSKGFRKEDAHLWWMYPENVGYDPKTTSSIEDMINRLGKLAGVENCHPHRFRRTGATMALRSGMQMIEVSKLLGHENVATTQIYLDIDEKQLQEIHGKYVR